MTASFFDPAALRTRLREQPSLDVPFLVILLALLSYGLIMLFSAGYAVALYRRGDAYTYIRPQLLFAALGAAAEPGLVPGSVLAAFEGSPAENAWFRQGYYHIEGQASQLAALCVEAKPGETVLDLCAAPGGKTLLLAEEMQGTGREP